jgi:hypothetical protein
VLQPGHSFELTREGAKLTGTFEVPQALIQPVRT